MNVIDDPKFWHNVYLNIVPETIREMNDSMRYVYRHVVDDVPYDFVFKLSPDGDYIGNINDRPKDIYHVAIICYIMDKFRLTMSILREDWYKGEFSETSVLSKSFFLNSDTTEEDFEYHMTMLLLKRVT